MLTIPMPENENAKNFYASFALFIAFILAFFGHKLYRLTVTVTGCILGGSLFGASIYWCLADYTSATQVVIDAWSIVATIIGAIIGASIVNYLRRVAVFCVGGFGGAMATFWIVSIMNQDIESLYVYIAAFAVGTIIGLFTLRLERQLMILATSFVGSFGMVTSISWFTNDYPHALELSDEWDSSWWYFIGLVVTFIVSVNIQLHYTSPEKKKLGSGEDNEGGVVVETSYQYRRLDAHA